MNTKIMSFFSLLSIICIVLVFGVVTSMKNQSHKKMSKENVVLVNEQERNNYWNAIKAIHNSEEKIREGNGHFQSRQYEKAAAAYEQAYNIGDKSVGGIKLAITYEKMGRNNEAIALLNKMISRGELSESGINYANTIKERLIKPAYTGLSPKPLKRE